MSEGQGAPLAHLPRTSSGSRAGRPTYFTTKDGQTWSSVHKDGKAVNTFIADFEGEFTQRLTAPPQTTNKSDSRTLAYYVTVRMGERSYDGVIPIEELHRTQWIDLIAPLVERRKTGANGGMGDLVNALISLSPNVRDVTAPTRLGWSNIIADNGELARVFVHAGGVLGERAGEAEVTTAMLGEEATNYLLPPPCPPAELKNRLQEFASFLHVAPLHVTAALLGLVLRAPLGRNPSALVLVAEKGTGKTALITNAVGITALGLSHEGGSLGSPEDTKNSMLYDMHHKADSIHVVDDYALTKLKKAQRMGELDAAVRQQFEGKGKGRLTRKIGRRPNEDPRGSLVISTEDTGLLEGSALERVVIVPVLARTVCIDMGTVTLKDLDAVESRERRASVYSAYVSWLSTLTHEEMTSRLRAYVAETVDFLIAHTFKATDDPDLRHKVRRVVNNVSQYMGGVDVFCEFLDAHGLEVESAQFRRTCLSGLEEVARRQVSVQDEVDLADKFVNTVQSAIQRGKAHVVGNGYGLPGATDFGHAPSLSDLHVCGWTASGTAMMDSARPNGEMIGYLAPGGRVLVTNWQVLMDIVGRELMEDAIGIDRQTILKELYARGVVEGKADSSRPFMVQRARPGTSGSSRQLKWVVDASAEALLGVSTVGDTRNETVDETLSHEEDKSPRVADPIQEPLTINLANVPASFFTEEGNEDEPEMDAVGEPPAPVDGGSAVSTGVNFPEIPTHLTTSYAVLDASGCYYPDGTRFADLPQDAHVGDLAVLAREHKTSPRGQSSILWVTKSAAQAWNLPDTPQSGKDKTPHPFVKDAVLSGFVVRDEMSKGKENGELRSVLRSNMWVSRQASADDVLGIGNVYVRLPSLEPDSYLADGHFIGETLEQLLSSLGQYASVAHVRFTGWPSDALEVLNKTRPNKPRKLIRRGEQDVSYPDAAISFSAALPVTSLRQPTAGESGRAYVHGYDQNGQFLSAAGNIAIPYGKLTHYLAPEFDPKFVGVWECALPRELSNALLPTFFAGLRETGAKTEMGLKFWPTEVVSLAVSLGVEVSVTQAYLWSDTYSGALSKWVRTLWDALDEAKSRRAAGVSGAAWAAGALKKTYTSFIGALSVGKVVGLDFPELAVQIRGAAMAKIARDVVSIGTATGEYPVAQFADTVYYLSDEPDPVKHAERLGLRLDGNRGSYRVTGTVTRESVTHVWTEKDGRPWTHPTRAKLDADNGLKTLVDAAKKVGA